MLHERSHSLYKLAPQAAFLRKQEPKLNDCNFFTAGYFFTPMLFLQQLQALGDTVGVVSRGAAENIMEGLRKATYAQHKPHHDKEPCTEQ